MIGHCASTQGLYELVHAKVVQLLLETLNVMSKRYLSQSGWQRFCLSCRRLTNVLSQNVSGQNENSSVSDWQLFTLRSNRWDCRFSKHIFDEEIWKLFSLAETAHLQLCSLRPKSWKLFSLAETAHLQLCSLRPKSWKLFSLRLKTLQSQIKPVRLQINEICWWKNSSVSSWKCGVSAEKCEVSGQQK